MRTISQNARRRSAGHGLWCGRNHSDRVTPQHFGFLPSGESVDAYELTSEGGAAARILTYGGIVASLRVPDRSGRLADVVLGFGDLAGYAAGHPYFGAITGRIAGRVTDGRISADGQDHFLECNDGRNHLHGGRRGLDKRIWSAQPSRDSGGASLALTYASADGEEGYPGALEISVTYTLTASNALVVETRATSDRPTPLCLAHHSYFNLAGEGSGTVLGHDVMIPAAEFVAADGAMTLSNHREPVEGRGADFRNPRLLGAALPDLLHSHGDLYLLRAAGNGGPEAPTLAARVSEPTSGRVLEVFTDESCLQFYTGVMLDGSHVGKSGKPYAPFAGLCLECQGYPNASVLGGFGDILVRPGEPQCRRTVYAFSVS
jgi:aldose 1-epimerase